MKSVSRRDFLAGAGGCLLNPTRAAAAHVRELAILEGTSRESASHYLAPFAAALRERGHRIDQDLRFIYRFANGDAARYAGLAAELIALNPNVILTGSTTATLACSRLTTRIPIVSSNLTDPIGAGLISSFARPGGNVTGVTVSFEGLPSKILHLLVEVLPSAQKVGVFANANERANKRQLEEVQRAADDRGIAIVSAQVRSADDFEGAFQELKQAGASAVYATSSLLLRTERMRFANAALSAQMPTFCNALEIAQAGALLSYGADLRENYRRAGYFVDRILRGARAGDLPTENPTRFVCSINMHTAKALGVALPPALFALADELIE